MYLGNSGTKFLVAVTTWIPHVVLMAPNLHINSQAGRCVIAVFFFRFRVSQERKGVERNYLRVSGKLIYFSKSHIWKYCCVYKICLKVHENQQIQFYLKRWIGLGSHSGLRILESGWSFAQWFETGVSKVWRRSVSFCGHRSCLVVWQTEGQNLAWAALYWPGSFLSFCSCLWCEIERVFAHEIRCVCPPPPCSTHTQVQGSKWKIIRQKNKSVKIT